MNLSADCGGTFHVNVIVVCVWLEETKLYVTGGSVYTQSTSSVTCIEHFQVTHTRSTENKRSRRNASRIGTFEPTNSTQATAVILIDILPKQTHSAVHTTQLIFSIAASWTRPADSRLLGHQPHGWSKVSEHDQQADRVRQSSLTSNNCWPLTTCISNITFARLDEQSSGLIWTMWNSRSVEMPQFGLAPR